MLHPKAALGVLGGNSTSCQGKKFKGYPTAPKRNLLRGLLSVIGYLVFTPGLAKQRRHRNKSRPQNRQIRCDRLG